MDEEGLGEYYDNPRMVELPFVCIWCDSPRCDPGWIWDFGDDSGPEVTCVSCRDWCLDQEPDE